MALIDDFARQRDESRKRLLLLMVGFALLAGIVLVRLTYLQVLRADDYRQQLDDWLVLAPDYLPPLRGDIRDRHGNALAQDVPSWQVEAYYAMLDSKLMGKDPGPYSRYVRNLARRLRRSGQMPADVSIEASEEVLHQRIDQSWQKLADLTGKPSWELNQTADTVVRRVRTMREHVAQNNGGVEIDVEEQRQFHPILKDIPMELANRLRLELTAYPWFRIHTSTSRQAMDDPAICHLIGRLKEADAEAIAKDPATEDEFRALRAGDRVGSDGVEYLGESLLRGRRGKIVRKRAGDFLTNIEAVRGQDVHLTIDLDLQRYVYEQLGQAVRACPTASGAAAVVLDVNTREVLAAVSWPGYTREQFAEDYDKLARDTVHYPLRYRPFADSYPAGSIVKPVTIMAALNSGLVTPDETINCTGHLIPGQDIFRCWTTSRGISGGHGPLTARQALQHSCNIYCYTMGGRLGVQRECEWFGMFGLGRSPGTGLLEEAIGSLPTMDSYKGRQAEMVGAARNLAIGQGELTLTPVQAANLSATIATGVWQPVTLLAEHAERNRAGRRVLPGTSGNWRIAREGMFDVVNDPAGTAYKYARSKGVEIAGKTGTAETETRKIGFVYDVKMHDGTTCTMEFTSRVEAADKFALMGETVVKWGLRGIRYWPAPPDPEHKPTHAWFMGFAPAHKPQVALAVLVEYGGGGSHIAGPVARDIFEHYFGVESQHAHEATDPGPVD